MFEYRHLRRLLFTLEPERAHAVALAALVCAGRFRPLQRNIRKRCAAADSRLEQKILGVDFANPVGLAAGFDKNGIALQGLASLGFGFLEAGTVTPEPQAGNKKPRVFRYLEQESLQNALGFNNDGLTAMQRRLSDSRPPGLPLGINIGKDRTTGLEAAPRDYAALLSGLSGLCDYFVINVSSPNTPGLRELQSRRMLAELITTGRELVRQPILVKLAPDLELGEALNLCRAAVAAGAAGLVLTNTTTDYDLLPGARPQGGLSGRVLRERSFEMLEAVAAELFGKCVLISVGGIDSPAEVYRRLRAGASLVQIYTGLIFRGPGLVRELNRGLLDLLDRDGVGSVEEIIGAGCHRPGPGTQEVARTEEQERGGPTP